MPANHEQPNAIPPLRLFGFVLLIVFCAETVVMLLLARLLPHTAHPLLTVLDAGGLVLLSAPLLWWVVVRPLQGALAEKAGALAANETLFREVNHRVKNKLQMLCDMLFVQSEAVTGVDAKQALCDAYGRVYTIARLHEQLYRAMQGGRIDLGQYLARLTQGFTTLYPAVPIRLEAPSGPLLLDHDRAIHVGLIVNELITNAVKHAFPGDRQGVVTVTLWTVGSQVEVQVADNGVGLPPDLLADQAPSLGLRLVHLLARRLRATVQTTTTEGTTFTLTFPLRAAESVRPDVA
jgi:two-component sensor histidine kinase